MKKLQRIKECIRMMKGQELINLFKYKTMLSYCPKCKKNTESINSKTSATSNGKTMTLSECVICDVKKSKFI